MFTDHNGNIIIETTMLLPWAPQPIKAQVVVARQTAQCLEPLPSDRDLPEVFGSVTLAARKQAAVMERDRHQLIAIVARQLAAALLTSVKSRDPQHGYSPEQIAEMEMTPP